MLVNSVSKSDGPFIQIDLISIDLVSAKEKSDAGKLSLLPNHVYWLCIDHLLVAKSAVMSVFPLHVEILVSAVTQINEPDSLYGIIQSHKELVLSVFRASEESTEYTYSTIIKLQIFYHLGMAWDLRWIASSCGRIEFSLTNSYL
uniref:Uncharacterized protein n=1 Tax=Quercus lobata TaxID=97700 RepID=A0A7N2R4L7_QUELO